MLGARAGSVRREGYDRDAGIVAFQLLVTGRFASPKSRHLLGLIVDFE
jgi:hypothetical protein